jgi:RNA polymerase sigma-70 factor, ECF subfamily
VARARTECTEVTEDSASAAHFARDVIPLLEPLRRRAIQLTSSIADAEDLLQETLLKAYAGRRSFQPNTNLKAWLFRIMTNVYISGYRTKKRRPAQYPTDQITDQQLAASAAHRSAGLWSAEERHSQRFRTPASKPRCRPCPHSSGLPCTSPTSRVSPIKRLPRSWRLSRAR